MTALNLKYKDWAGAKQAITSVQVPINWVSDVENDGTDWVVLDVPPSAASTTVSGIVELATSAEAIAGSDAVRAITPATLFGGLNASGSAPIYACRAWVNFNGTGTVAISASGNVSSITDNGVGTYTINFTTSMPTPNYAVFGTANFSTGIAWIAAPSSGGTKSVSQVAIVIVDSANFADLTNVSISVFC